MKTKNLFIAVSLVVVSSVMFSCKKETVDEPTTQSTILPSKFKVDIPNAISNSSSSKSASVYLKSAKSGQADTIKGSEIYTNLKTFIFVGESAGDMVESIIKAIGYYKINKPLTMSYTSDDDNRYKNLVVEENQSYNGATYQFSLTITDALSVSDADGGKAMQVFWNTNPISGVAILKPYNINRTKDLESPNALFRIEYSEVATDSYDSHMLVEIDGLTMPDANIEPYAISTLKMFVGKKGDRVDVYGNSEHPNAKLFSGELGFDWAFVASGFDSQDIAVAEVGLPAITLDNSTRKVLLEDYSVKNVFTSEINKWFIAKWRVTPDSASLSRYLKDADAPGFFSNSGFIQAGVSPNNSYTELVNQIKLLSPYNPKDINELSIGFK
jgi:hypothetical protein